MRCRSDLEPFRLSNIMDLTWEKLDLRARWSVMRGGPAEEAVARLASAVGDWQEWDWPLLRSLLGKWEEAGGQIDAGWLAEDSAWRGSPTGRWLLADAWTRGGRKEEALALWDESISADGPDRADALLARARLHRDLGRPAAALADLRAAASSVEYAVLMKISRLFDRISRTEPPTGRPIKIALLFSSSADLVAPLLRLACFRVGLVANLYAAPYGSHRQEILNPLSGLYRFGPDVVILGTHWRDAHLTMIAGNGDAEVARLWADFTEQWQTLQSRHAGRILQHSFDLPAAEPGGYLSSSESGGRVRVLRRFNAQLWAEKPSGVVVVDTERLAAEAGAQRWEDASQWHLAKQHPGPDAIPLLVNHYAALIRASLGIAKKVLVLDLDNTLWGGVVGEDGVGRIQIGAPSAVGEAHARLQSYVKDLKARGVLLAVCSKNNEADARAPFREHEGMVLKEEDFVAFCANWKNKAENVRQIAQSLGLGLDSFVFVDDNPVERESMRQQVPEVEVIDLGNNPTDYVERLHSSGWFESIVLSAEDVQRHAAYQANAQRVRQQAAATTVDGFLQGLRMQMYHGAIDKRVLDRVVQLLGKTNQFNLTTRRHNPEKIREFMKQPRGWTQYFRLADCYGDNGIIGVIISTPSDSDQDTCEIDTFLMSCRVIGRRAEDFMLSVFLRAALAAGYGKARGIFVPTMKNDLAADLYLRAGFSADPSYRGAGKAFLLNIPSQTVPDHSFIESVAE